MTEQTAAEEKVKLLCSELKLPSVGRNAARVAEESERQRSGHLDYLLQLLETESEGRKERRAKRRLRQAGFPIVKTLEGFDFGKAAGLPRTRIMKLAEGGYITAAEPVLFLGEPGTGKTHLATALGVAAARQGRSVRFTTAAGLATELAEARDSFELGRVVRRHSKVELLIIDELAYLPLSKTDSELLFRVLGERQERRPLIVTTNLPFSEWTSMIPDTRLCRALVDRLTHRAHIIETGKESMRLRESLERKA